MQLLNKIALYSFSIATLLGKLYAQKTISNLNFEVKNIISQQDVDKTYQLNYKYLILPAVFITYGFTCLDNNNLKQINLEAREFIMRNKPKRITLDDYTQYAPAALVYGLNAIGVKGKHNLLDRSIIYATSQLISATLITPLKHTTHEKRPDGSNYLSFPSGHTATAFSSAHFMFREYKDTNFWLGVCGYSLAIFTGTYRTINNKHWVSDVVAGAGFGILSTEMAYWLFPKIKQLFENSKSKTTTMVMPFYQNNQYGIGFIRTF